MAQVLLADSAQGKVHLRGEASGEESLKARLRQVKTAIDKTVADSVAGRMGGERAVAAQQVWERDAVGAGDCGRGERVCRVEVRDPAVLGADAVAGAKAGAHKGGEGDA